MKPRLFCIFCALLASVLGLLLWLSPSPSMAEEPAADELPEQAVARFGGDAGDTLRRVDGTVRLLGSDKLLTDFRLLVLARTEDGVLTADVATDAKGRYRIEAGQKVLRLELFSYGDFVVGGSWRNVPMHRMAFDGPETWNIFVRPLGRVRLEGEVTRQDNGAPAERAAVYLAPLDVMADGSAQVFEEPFSTRTDEHGRYFFEAPAGYYRVWAVWADRSDSDEWPGFIAVEPQLGLFADAELNLSLELGPKLNGRVVDARTGEGAAAEISLYSNLYLRQLRNMTADGQYPDEEGPGGEDVFWPVGTFRFQVFMADPSSFAAVIHPRGDYSTVKVISGLDAAKLGSEPLEWRLYEEDDIVLDLSLKTHELDLPIFGLDITAEPRELDMEPYLRKLYRFTAVTDDDGGVRFQGMAPGLYEIFCDHGNTLLGSLTVTAEKRQTAAFVYRIPFAAGLLKYEDGTVCKNAQCVVYITFPDGSEGGPFFRPAFPGATNSENGSVLVPLTVDGATFRLRFYAWEDNREIGDDWNSVHDFPFATDEVEFKVDGEKAYTLDLTLKPQKKDD